MYFVIVVMFVLLLYWSFSQLVMINNWIFNVFIQVNGVDIIGMDFVGEIDYGFFIIFYL